MPMDGIGMSGSAQPRPTGLGALVDRAPWVIERAICAARKSVPGLPTGFRFQDLRYLSRELLIVSGLDVEAVQTYAAGQRIDDVERLLPSPARQGRLPAG